MRGVEDILGLYAERTPPPAYSAPETARGRRRERGNHRRDKREGSPPGKKKGTQDRNRHRRSRKEEEEGGERGATRSRDRKKKQHAKNLEKIFGARPFSLHAASAFPFSFTSTTNIDDPSTATSFKHAPASPILFLDNPLFLPGSPGIPPESPSYTLTAQRMRVEAQEIRLRLAETELEIELVRLRRLLDGGR